MCRSAGTSHLSAEDGIVVVDNKRCVGCAYCVGRVLYDARFINHETQTADKCTFASIVLEAGLLPACVEVLRRRRAYYVAIKISP
ncbi:hypothetical protein KCP74_19270 [Salmonella enterica subsp. enterica]|nr:hypothetical protein KCP74_19270 [Salmonella enterica subsp. enterica]